MENRIIANIKSLGLDMIHEAKSGHPGIVLGAAPIMYTLFSKHLIYNKDDSEFLNRDRFILSAGHGSALLYSTLYMCGCNYSLDDLKNFRQKDSITPGHPEYGIAPSVEATTGPLGQGIATAVGMALASKIGSDRYRDNDGSPVINNNVYVLCGDGDLMEGISYEACSFAGTMNLSNLIILYDSNNISLDGGTDKTFTENVLQRFHSMGFDTFEVENGDSVNDIDNVINIAKLSNKPSIIKINTIIGKGSLLESTHKIHGKLLEAEDLKQLRKKLNIKEDTFYVDNEAKEYFTNELFNRSIIEYKKFNNKFNSYLEYGNPSIKDLREDKGIDIDVDEFNDIEKIDEATRITNGKVMQILVKNIPKLLGGSADLSSSTMTYIEKGKDIVSSDYNGKNIWFGVREHAMGAILNGLSLCNFRVYGSTFLTFSDYLKPAIRLSALMNKPVNYIFTHDSITVGEDGPTHEPIEQLAMLRTIPNLNVYRPCDTNEVIGSWVTMLKEENSPNALILSRSNVKALENSSLEKVKFGAYIIKKEKKDLKLQIIATGSEVSTAIEIATELESKLNIGIRVVSMPCMEKFEQMDEEYKNITIGKNIKTVVIEAGSKTCWGTYAKTDENLITIDKFGISAKTEDVLEELDFSYAQIKKRIEKIVEV
jgi:transketolase, bacterial and yeast